MNNLVDLIWVKNRPLYPIHDAFIITNEIAGESYQSKFERVRRTLRSMDCDALVVTALDEIAWLLNIRAWDLPHSPFLRAYLAIFESQVLLYTDDNKLPHSVRTYLRIDSCTSPLCVRVKEYEKVWSDLKNIGVYWTRVWLPSQIAYSAGVSKAIHSLFNRDKQYSAPSPIIEMKALKNDVEIKGMHEAHIRDAVIFCDALAYLEDQYFQGELISEQSIASTLDTFRKENTLSRGISFDSVVAYGEHAALPHYNPSNVTNKVVGNENPVLIDSGGHYMEVPSTQLTFLHHSFCQTLVLSHQILTDILSDLFNSFLDQIRYLNAYNQRIADAVGSELKRQKKMAGFYWLEKRLLTYDIPHSKANDAGDLASPHVFLLLVAFLCSCLIY
ncbi:hypothetical protein WDU94_010996 [Cyamophila willieti]